MKRTLLLKLDQLNAWRCQHHYNTLHSAVRVWRRCWITLLGEHIAAYVDFYENEGVNLLSLVIQRWGWDNIWPIRAPLCRWQWSCSCDTFLLCLSACVFSDRRVRCQRYMGHAPPCLTSCSLSAACGSGASVMLHKVTAVWVCVCLKRERLIPASVSSSACSVMTTLFNVLSVSSAHFFL